MLEKDITAAIQRYLKTVPHCFFWKEHGGQYGTAGLPDIICCYRGRFVAFEVKTPTGKPSKLQEITIAKIKAAKGEAFIVRSVKEVQQILESLEVQFMTIAWTYLDKRGAAVDALKDFASMEYIIDNHDDDEEAVREDMTAVGSPALGGQPSGHNPHGGEARLTGQIDEIDVLKERYRQALEYMAWFRPAWEALTEDERFILREFFMRTDINKTEAMLNIGDRLHFERAQVYRCKDKALNRLALLLYGK